MKAGSKGKSASSVLVELVNSYITSTTEQIDNTDINYITYIDNKLDELRKELLTVIEQLKLDRANITDNNYINYITDIPTDVTSANEIGVCIAEESATRLVQTPDFLIIGICYSCLPDE